MLRCFSFYLTKIFKKYKKVNKLIINLQTNCHNFFCNSCVIVVLSSIFKSSKIREMNKYALTWRRKNIVDVEKTSNCLWMFQQLFK